MLLAVVNEASGTVQHITHFLFQKDNQILAKKLIDGSLKRRHL